MDSNEINEFAQKLGIKDFIGVFAVDELRLIPKSMTGLLIFNTDTSQNIGQHWIALCITKTTYTILIPFPVSFNIQFILKNI